MSRLEAGDSILDVVGPLGVPSEIGLFGRAVLVGGDSGSPPFIRSFPNAPQSVKLPLEFIIDLGAKHGPKEKDYAGSA